MKFLKKTLSVGLSLVLCASMVAPGFAASFADLQGVIDRQESLYDDAKENLRIDYNGGKVTLYEEVTRGDKENGKSITISGKDKNVTIDLNGQAINGGDKNGSVIKVTDGASLTIDDSGKNGAIKGGNATFGGGVYVNGASLTLKDGTISGNTSTAEGGGVYVVDGSTFTMEGGEISGNTAKNTGGGVFVANFSNDPYNEAPSQFTMNAGKISGNVTGNNTNGAGGGVGAYGHKQNNSNVAVTINGGEISGNTTGANGGGISVQNGALTITGGTVSGNVVKNSAGGLGGGIYIYDSSASIKNATIEKNNGAANGGGIYANVGGNTIELNDNTITSNTATNFGGGVYANSAIVNMDGNTISSNTAKLGGGMFAQGSHVTMDGDKINNNNAASGGGVYNFSKSVFEMNSGEISGNTVTASGGGIYNDVATFTMNDGEISNNTAIQGSGIYANGKSGNTAVNMNGGSISGNTASTAGGGVRLATGARFTMDGGSISGNSATSGAGVYSYSGTTFTMNGGEITENTATGNGGGVYSNTANLAMTGGKIYNNSAANSSDDVYGYANGYSITLITAEEMGAEIDGETVNRWLWDSKAIREEDGYSVWSLTGDAVLYLKAAPAQMFTVNVSDGYSDTPILSEVLERNTEFPEIEEPTRPGYTFAGWSMELPELVEGNISLVANWTENPTDPTDPGIEVEDPDVPLGDEPEVEITDPAIPLAAGPVTRAQFVDYLWRHEGEPAPVQDDGLFEDVTVEHEYSPAMAWAKSIGIIEAYEDGTFEPDELVTVAAVRSILTRFAAYTDMAMPELTTLTGGDDEAVLNCDQVLAEFFGEEYTAPDADVEVDTAV